MKPEQSQAIIKRLIEQIENNTTECAEHSMQVDAKVFTEASHFQQELSCFFKNSPQVIGFAGELKEKGSYLTTECLGTPLLLTRDENGKVHAFLNACAHRGAKVATGASHTDGTRKRLICQFHGWAYDLNGRLYGRPKDDCFTPAGPECNLQALPVSEKYGVLVVGLNQSISQHAVDAHLDSIGPELIGFHFENMNALGTRKISAKANWKLIAGLSHESYHFATLHRDSVAQYLKANAVYDTFKTHSRWAFALKGLEKLKETEESSWPHYLPGAINHTLFPGTVLITNPEDAQMIRVEPGQQPNESIIYFSGMCRDAKNKENALNAFEFGYKVFTEEDLPAAEQCQQGFDNGLSQMLIGRNEPIVSFWHKLWQKQLDQHHTQKLDTTELA